jgi:hypothetical protein
VTRDAGRADERSAGSPPRTTGNPFARSGREAQSMRPQRFFTEDARRPYV